MAVIDGIQNKINPGDPLDKDIYDLPPEEAAAVPKTPAFAGSRTGCPGGRTTSSCCKGDVFTEDVISTWISYKMENEVDAMRLRPHPYEFCLYYDM